MLNNTIRIFFIGDIVGRYARKFLDEVLPHMKKKFVPDLVVANGENLAGGLGLTRKTVDEIFHSGVHVITTGNHVWDKKEALDLLEKEEFIIRPINFPASAPGSGFCQYKIRDDVMLVMVNLQGRVFMEPVVDNPFLAMKDLLKRVRSKIILVDFHAEASAEKQAMGFYLNGKVSAVLGTHTHVPSADLRILSHGTAYQTDVGMTGSLDSVIGMKKQPIISKFLTGINQRFEVAKKDLILDAAILDIDITDGHAVRVESLRLHEASYREQL
jgi:metallophosphoesterase (TIGR00282 family)